MKGEKETSFVQKNNQGLSEKWISDFQNILYTSRLHIRYALNDNKWETNLPLFTIFDAGTLCSHSEMALNVTWHGRRLYIVNSCSVLHNYHRFRGDFTV